MEPTAKPIRDEAALIARIVVGEKELFYELMRPYERSLYFAAYSVLQNEADAEETAQEAVLKAFKALPSFRAEAKFSTWLLQIGINEARMRRRKDRKALYDALDAGKQGEDGDYIPSDFEDWREIPLESLERKEVRRALAKAMQQLPEIYREVFFLRDVQQKSIEETAAILAITVATVKTRLLRARLQMRDKLAPGWGSGWAKAGSLVKKKQKSGRAKR